MELVKRPPFCRPDRLRLCLQVLIGSKEIVMTQTVDQLTYYVVASVVAGYSLALLAQIALYLAA